jgi:hypothetical protein
VPMMVTLLGAILLLGGIFCEPHICPQHGWSSLVRIFFSINFVLYNFPLYSLLVNNL